MAADLASLRDVVRHLRSAPPPLDDASDPGGGDHVLNPTALPLRPPRPAAVLVGLVERQDGLGLILTERGAHLRAHSGQISLPGGKIDPEDASPLAAALREAEEEIGLPRHFVDPLGYGDAYRSTSGYDVVPVVGVVRPDFVAAPNPAEVSDVFEVSFAYLMNPRNYEVHARRWNGRVRQYYVIACGDRLVWGVTAGILRNLCLRLYPT